MPNRYPYAACLLVLTVCSARFALAEWKAANEQVTTAAKDPRIAAVLAAVNEIDASLLTDNHAAFAAHLAPGLVVNTPQNTVNVNGGTAQRNTAGLISYSSYSRSVEYAGMLQNMVLLMGEERVVPKAPAPRAGDRLVRRFTDSWTLVDGRWLLLARQATIVPPQP